MVQHVVYIGVFNPVPVWLFLVGVVEFYFGLEFVVVLEDVADDGPEYRVFVIFDRGRDLDIEGNHPMAFPVVRSTDAYSVEVHFAGGFEIPVFFLQFRFQFRHCHIV